jgi:hypothetical protein
MGDITFKKGTFITTTVSSRTFAIFGGETYLSSKKKGQIQRSLICYYDPAYLTYDKNGQQVIDEVFECDTVGDDCGYVISNDDSEWRECTSSEIATALKLLSEKKGLIWDSSLKKLVRLSSIDDLPFDVGPTQDSTTEKKVGATLIVDENWLQKYVLKPSTQDISDLLVSQCIKLENSFSYLYEYGNDYNYYYC